MPVSNVRKTQETNRIETVLKEHFPDFPEEFPPSAYRYNSASIRVRVVSDEFLGKNRAERNHAIYAVLKANLSERTLQDITLVLALAPAEVGDSLMNREFDHPTPSQL